ncbi:hypothetical protein [Piscinibacter sp. XHJ-5]|uniref:hypothetical protein n=1 Tax=Piscinibacter sp. XHJ-5 TaxID=3037797 RepID=UPI0024535EF3|nr:hypothetical protein [Piscinibacter sp. XHJ-5]
MPADPDLDAPARRLLAIAQRVADAHLGIDDASLMSCVSGSTVDNIADARSDVDMSVVFAKLPDEAVLRDACRRAGGDWFWSAGNVTEGLVVSFRVDGVEVQIGYNSEAGLIADLDEVLVRHNPDTPNHKLAEGILKSMPLAGADRLAALQRRLAEFPPKLGRAMVVHGLIGPVSWRGVSQLLHRDAGLWCREIQVDACYRHLLILSGLNRRYFTRFQVKRMQRLASRLEIAPPQLAGRIDTLLSAPHREAFGALHALEREVLDLVAEHMPDVELAAARTRWGAFAPD